MKIYPFLYLLPWIMIYQNLAATEMKERPDPKTISITTKQPEENKKYPIAIIGAGAAGTMAVNRAVLNNDEVLLFTGAKEKQRGSRGYWVRKVDNIPGFAKYERTILEVRNEVLEELAQSPLNHNLFVIEDSINTIEKEDEFFKLIDGLGRIYYAKYVVLATGIMDVQPEIQGSIRPILKYANGQTVAYCALCDGHRSFGKKTVVIGYSDTAAETALLLSDKYHLTNLTILTNGRTNEFHPDLLKKIKDQNIRILESPIQEILGDKDLKQLSGFKLENEELAEAEIAFISLGLRPNNQLALQLGAKVTASGLVITNSSSESSVPNLFVIGDLQANTLKQIYTAWQQAVDSLLLINCRIIGCE